MSKIVKAINVMVSNPERITGVIKEAMKQSASLYMMVSIPGQY